MEPKDLNLREIESGLVSMPTPTPKFEYNPLEIISRVVPTYDTTEGFRTKDGNLYFSDYPQFAPNLTPLQMIRAGVFGGCYFNPRGGRPGIISPKGIDINYKEFPSSWFAGLHESLFISRRYVIATNKYGVKAGQDQAAWEQSGWIHPQDPRGWFQWYCRFFMGRRSADDERQMHWAKRALEECVMFQDQTKQQGMGRCFNFPCD